MRHGEASVNAPSDSQRPLTMKGIQQAEQVGNWLATEAIYPKAFWVSPYLRAEQTYQHLVNTLYENSDNTHKFEIVQGITPSGDATLVANRILQLAKQNIDSLMIISHLPLVGYLVEELCFDEDALMFQTADIACIVLDEDLNGILLWNGSPLIS